MSIQECTMLRNSETNAEGSKSAYLEQIDFLRDHFSTLVEYYEQQGSRIMPLRAIEDGLFDQDPFVVYGASLLAAAFLSDERLYH